jgi:osmotically-inducible protein OsmY
VRAAIGHRVSHPGAIQVDAHNGTVVLSGPILAREVDDLIGAVESVRGVASVEGHLDIHDSAESISALQGTGRRGSI